MFPRTCHAKNKLPKKLNSYEIVNSYEVQRCVHIWAVVFQLPKTPLKVTTLSLNETMVCYVDKHVGQS